MRCFARRSSLHGLRFRRICKVRYVLLSAQGRVPHSALYLAKLETRLTGSSSEWLPASCYDRAVAEVSESNLSDLYPAAAGRTTFPLFWDQAMIKPATLEDVMLAAFENIENGFQIEFYTAWEFHRAHCLHLWRLTVSALEQLDRGKRNVGVYYKSVSPEHAWHCNRFIVDGDTRDPDKITSIAPGVGKCVVLNSF